MVDWKPRKKLFSRGGSFIVTLPDSTKLTLKRGCAFFVGGTRSLVDFSTAVSYLINHSHTQTRIPTVRGLLKNG